MAIGPPAHTMLTGQNLNLDSGNPWQVWSENNFVVVLSGVVATGHHTPIDNPEGCALHRFGTQRVCWLPGAFSRANVRSRGLQPCGKGCHGFSAGTGLCCFPFIHQPLARFNSPRHVLRLVLQIRFSRFACLAVFIDGIEERRHAVIICLRYGIIFVVVALAAAKCQSQPCRAHGIDTVDHIINSRLFRIPAALAVGHMVPMKCCGEHLLRTISWQQITRALFQCEAVEWHIGAKCVHNPVAPGPVGAIGIALKTIGVGVACRIEPVPCHALGKGVGGHQFVAEFADRSSRCIAGQTGYLGFRWW